VLLHLLAAGIGTKLPIRDARFPVANGGKTDNMLNVSSSHFAPKRSFEAFTRLA
jgi:hypothetical protein